MNYLTKNFNITILKMFNELKENTERQLSEIKKKCINKIRISIKTIIKELNRNPGAKEHNKLKVPERGSTSDLIE